MANEARAIWDFTGEALAPDASVYELVCDCGALYAVYNSLAVWPPIECECCGLQVDHELAALDPCPSDAGYESDGPDVQVFLTHRPR